MALQTHMSTEELRFIGTTLFPEGGWQKRLGMAIGRNTVSMSRWANGLTPIGQSEASLLRLIYQLEGKGMNWRKMLEKSKEKIAEKMIEALRQGNGVSQVDIFS